MVSAHASGVVTAASDSRWMSDGDPTCPTLPGMHYDVRSRPAVLRHDPFKALAGLEPAPDRQGAVAQEGAWDGVFR